MGQDPPDDPRQPDALTEATWPDPGAPAAASAPPEAARYQVGAQLGRGALGRVVSVYDRALGRTLARKELVRRTARNEARFLREAAITARLEHPNIPPVHDVGHGPSGPWYTMKVVEGRSLQAAIADARGLPERLALVDRVIDVGRALAYAHAEGVVHRDVKPSNVMLGSFGETWLVDWGLAIQRSDPDDRPADEDDDDPDLDGRLTRVGAVMGTPRYMSPEQARGEVVGAASDQWALGAILYVLLLGRPMLQDLGPEEVVARVAAVGVAPVSGTADLPPELAAVVDRALSFDPADRYPGMDELVADLVAWRSGGAVQAYGYSATEALGLWARAHRLPLTLGAVAVAIGVAFLATTFGTMWSSSVRIAREVEQKRSALVAAHTREARASALDGDLTTAALYATEALKLGEAPVARGVMARAMAGWSPRLEAVWPTPVPCLDLRVVGDAAYCAGGDTVVKLVAGEVAWRHGLPDPARHVAAGSDRLVVTHASAATVLDAATGELVAQLALPERATAVDVSSTGSVVLVTRSTTWLDGVEWPLGVCRGEAGSVRFAGGTDLSVLCLDGRVLRVDTATRERHELAGVGEAAFAMLRDPPAFRVGVRGRVREVGADPSVRGWDAGRGQVVDLARSPDGRWMVAGTDRGDAVVWPWDRSVVAATLPAHGGLVRVAFDGAGRLLTSSSKAPGIRVWRLPPPTGLAGRHPPGVSDLALSPDGTELLVRLGSGVVRRLDMATMATLEEWSDDRRRPLMGFGWLDGRPVLAFGDGTWNREGPAPFRVDPPSGPLVWRAGDRFVRRRGDREIVVSRPADLDRDLARWQSTVPVVAVAEAGRAVAAIDAEGVVLLDDHQLTEIARLPLDVRGLSDVSLSDDGRRVAIGEGLDGLRVVDLEGGVERVLSGQAGRCSALRWWTDDVLVSGHWDSEIRVWDLSRADPLVAVLEGHEGRVGLLARTGDILLSTGWDGQILRWDLAALEASPDALTRWARDLSGLELGASGPLFVGVALGPE